MRIRMNILCDSTVNGEAYLGRNGCWTTWAKAAKFSSVGAAESFAARHGIDLYGIF